jgi:hypothetical protein
MKWLTVIAAVFAVVVTVLFFRGGEERECLHMLANCDHNLNCLPCAALAEEMNQCTNGVITQEFFLMMTPTNWLRCPVSGTNYILAFKVGEHPYCPVHGRLIEKYNVRPHHGSIKAIVPAALVFVSIF